MKEIYYIITDKSGIHARPAGLMAKEAEKFQSRITIEKGEKQVDAKRIFGIMGLAAKQGEKIRLIAEGSDETEAIAVMEKFLKENL